MNFRTNIPRVMQTAALLITVTMVAPAVAAAQGSTPVVPAEEIPRTLTVTGTGLVEITPDTADVTFAVYSQNESLEVAQDDNSQRLEAIMQVLTDAGIAEKDIATSNYSVRVVNEYDRDGNLVGVTGYEVWAALNVTIRDISAVGTILDEAVGAGANEITSISFYVDDTDAAASQARAIAIENARVIADEMAEAAGVLVVGVYSIEEVSAPVPNAVQYDMVADRAGSAEAAPQAVPISPGQTSITVDVKIVFEIEQPQG